MPRKRQENRIKAKDDRKGFKLKKDATAEPFIWGKGWDCKAVKE